MRSIAESKGVVSSYRKSLDFIYNLRGAETRGAEFDLRLERVARALSLFGNPQDSFRACHVAGTNGKGSTAAIIHSVLSAQRYRVGLYTSPHLADFSERIRVGKRPISRAAVAALVREVAERTARASLSLTFYQLALVADRDDDEHYDAGELQDILASLNVAPLPGDHLQLLAMLTGKFDDVREAIEFTVLTDSMQALYSKGYRFTDADQAAMSRVTGES